MLIIHHRYIRSEGENLERLLTNGFDWRTCGASRGMK
jgi:hypothetical protein